MNPILLMSENVEIALISGGTGIITALIAAIGTFQLSTKKDRQKQREDLKAELITYHNKNREEIDKIRQNDLREIRDDITQMGANLQQKVAVIEIQIDTLSSRVEKHNQVVERTFKLEQAVEDIRKHT